MLKVMTVCYGGSAWLAEELRPIITELEMELLTVHEWDTANIKWKLDTWLDELRKADVIICPANYKVQPAKSANRLTQALSLGKPTIVSPLDAYLQVEKKYPGSFLIADTKEEWAEKLKLLRDDQGLREDLSKKALEASRDYSIASIGKKWVNLLFGEKIKEPAVDIKASTAPVDLIIVNYNNVRYLKLCVYSIYKNTKHPFNLIISDAGSDDDTWEYLNSLKNVSIVGSKTIRRNYSEACNAGIAASHAEYFAILNSDLVMSEGWLSNIMAKFQTESGLGACGVYSNCDRNWLHQDPMMLKSGLDLVPGMKYEQIETHFDELYSFMAESNGKKKGQFKDQDWVAGYATVYPRKVVQDVGLFDPVFKNGCEDLDFCRRLRKKDYKIGQSLDSFVYHFGGVSRGCFQEENRESYGLEDQANHACLGEKWNKENVVIYTGPMWHKWDFRNVDEGGIGGSETWAVMLAREFIKMGYRVKVFADCPQPGIKDGEIEYLHYTQYNDYINYNWIDYFISSRTTDPFNFPVRAGKTFVQIHDIFLLSPKDQLHMDKINKFCVLSKWHGDFVKGYHGLTDDKLALTANGIDFNRYAQPVEKYPHRLFWSSSLDRGLDTLLYMFDFIKEQIPDLELHVFYGTEIWQAAAQQRNNADELKKIEDIKNAMNKPGVFYHGRIGQKDLAVEQMKSSLWAYPTDFEESFCITAIEAQAAGCPVIASNYAGLQTTVGDSGILIENGTKGQSFIKEYREEFVSKVVQIFKDKELYQEFVDKGKKNAEKYSWKSVAEIWQKLFKGDV